MKLHLYPAAILYVLNAVVALFVSFGAVSANTAHVVTVVATAVLGFIVACTTRPVVPATVGAAFATILTAIAGFGIHMSAAEVGAVATIVSLIVGAFVHSAASPVSAWKQGLTVETIERRAAAGK